MATVVTACQNQNVKCRTGIPLQLVSSHALSSAPNLRAKKKLVSNSSA